MDVFFAKGVILTIAGCCPILIAVEKMMIWSQSVISESAD